MKLLKDLQQMKREHVKLTMMTAYDYPSAKQVEAAGIDMILVGDSLGMTVLGYDSTVYVTMEDMIHHTKAVRRGAPDTFTIIDMPFGSVGISEEVDLMNAVRLYRDSGAHAVKAEGGHLTAFIQQCANLGIPVVAHLGLTPQSAGLTGYAVQAKTKEAAEQLIAEAQAVEAAGAVMLVLEAVPSDLAAYISGELSIPVIGIGAGRDTDGQVLVYHDVLNYATDRKPKFVKQYGDFSAGIEALSSYNNEVKAGQFPTDEFTYKAKIMGEVAHD
ncbi:3-methyl-2-oxobutanoate hydroxymethyltransferase [Macrococcus equipercicus]|uniref:3-methyl-2-oxobutanoate hydroxymethyltransferase n=1 Tax=Macrococcus equipercicus TaxID=69967 RepID=A0A9Q9BY44_9STAP|nr:3-methyl-2-oxobutanoate hydroxymethyltransferase [Macrococcus equipercicus]KAA1040321.1 3-methyl-2-oxobutanoate hydroxymethyltransferase [Macrococcus equipercicus]UTH14797.1 3-methyl-2-oxobutanoate hydroxymethyltransferase [Macrococcus equipercicus]